MLLKLPKTKSSTLFSMNEIKMKASIVRVLKARILTEKRKKRKKQ